MCVVVQVCQQYASKIKYKDIIFLKADHRYGCFRMTYVWPLLPHFPPSRRALSQKEKSVVSPVERPKQKW
jgi:hypothetical protein